MVTSGSPVRSLMISVHKVLYRQLLLLAIFFVVIGHLLKTKPKLTNIYFREQQLMTTLRTFKASIPEKFPSNMRTSQHDPDMSILIKPLGVVLCGYGGVTIVWVILWEILLRFRLLPKTYMWLIYMLGCAVIFTAALCQKFIEDEMMRAELMDLLPNYGGLGGQNQSSLVLNSLMQGFQCCGVNDYQDFIEDAPGWPPKDFNFNSSGVKIISSWKNSSTSPTFLTPIACCRNASYAEFGCFVDGVANEHNNYMYTGCFDALSARAGRAWNNIGTALVVFALLYFGEIIVCTYFVFSRKSFSIEE